MPSPRQGAMWPTWLSFDDDFKELPYGSQWLFRLLWTHPDLNSGGYITLAPRAWADCASDLDANQVEAQLDGLMAMQHHGRPWVSVDDRTAELLVRPFVELDAQKKPHIYVSAMRAVQSCRSPSLRADGWSEIRAVYPPFLRRDPKKDPEVYDKLERDRDAAYFALLSVMEGNREPFANRSRTVREHPSGLELGSGNGDARNGDPNRKPCAKCGERPAQQSPTAWHPEWCKDCDDALRDPSMRRVASTW